VAGRDENGPPTEPLCASVGRVVIERRRPVVLPIGVQKRLILVVKSIAKCALSSNVGIALSFSGQIGGLFKCVVYYFEKRPLFAEYEPLALRQVEILLRFGIITKAFAVIFVLS
jgi:hypothetical protein